LLQDAGGGVNAELVGEAIGAESLGSMREVHVAAVDLQRFDELFRAEQVLL
jgi:hypothetical protein